MISNDCPIDKNSFESLCDSFQYNHAINVIKLNRKMGTTSSSCLSSSFLQLKEIEIEIGKAAPRRTFVEYTQAVRFLRHERTSDSEFVACANSFLLPTSWHICDTGIITHERTRCRSLVVRRISRNGWSISRSREESGFEVNRFYT